MSQKYVYDEALASSLVGFMLCHLFRELVHVWVLVTIVGFGTHGRRVYKLKFSIKNYGLCVRNVVHHRFRFSSDS